MVRHWRAASSSCIVAASTEVMSTKGEAQGPNGSAPASTTQQLPGYQPELASPAKTYLKVIAAVTQRCHRNFVPKLQQTTVK